MSDGRRSVIQDQDTGFVSRLLLYLTHIGVTPSLIIITTIERIAMKSEIRKLEEKLRQAMLNSDVELLNELIDNSLTFIGPDGQVATKQMDLDAYRKNLQKMSELNPLEQSIQVSGDLAIITVIMDVVGSIGEMLISGKYRYLRVWYKTNKAWKIIAGSVIKLPS